MVPRYTYYVEVSSTTPTNIHAVKTAARIIRVVVANPNTSPVQLFFGDSKGENRIASIVAPASDTVEVEVASPATKNDIHVWAATAPATPVPTIVEIEDGQ